MQNGQVNGGAPAQQTQVNPQQAAAFALQFLVDVPHTRAQREAYDMATMLLQAIVSGQVMLMQNPQAQVAPPAVAADAPGDAPH